MIYSAKCSSPKCNRNVVWIKMQSGKKMICDPGIVCVADHPEHLGKKLVTGDGLVVTATRDTIGFVPHWATCPDTARFRKGNPNGGRT